jgi:hypothetical protein
MAGDDDGEWVTRQGSADGPGTARNTQVPRYPAVGADPAPGDLALSEEDTGLEFRAALKGQNGQIESDGPSLKEAPYLLGKPGYGVT